MELELDRSPGCLLPSLPAGHLAAPPGSRTTPATRTLTAETHDSGFALAHDTYNGLSSASDGRIYYVLSSEPFDTGARVFVFDPATSKIHDLGDLTEACGEKGMKAIVQGKSHVNFVECQRQALLRHPRRLLLDHRRHGEDGRAAPRAMKPYPGGHLLAYDMASGKFENLAIAPSAKAS